jgi:prepilin-type processing-associated H-X9-DG protein
MKQLGIALHNYHDSLGGFPPGRLRVPVDGQGRCFSAYAFLLPYLEATALYKQVDFLSNPDSSPTNALALGQTIPYFLCPSDSDVELQLDSAVHNYPLNTGTTFPVSPRNPGRIPVTGVFYENSATNLREISDGSSQTICIAETVKSTPGMGEDPPGLWNGRPTNGFVLTTGNDNSSNGPELTDYAGQCVPGNRLQQTRGSRWLYGAPGHSMYNHIRAPNDPGIDCRGGLPHSTRTNHWWDRLSHNVTAHSLHPGGVHALYCDAHVDFATDSIALPTWQALGSRNGGEPIAGQ